MSYSIALIGCGRVGVWLEDDPKRSKPATHLGGIQKIIDTGLVPSGLTLKALCDIDTDRLTRCSERCQLDSQHTYTDYRELILKEKPDIVIIATWTASHKDISIFAAQQGVKGIVLEKPIAASLKHAKEIISTCRKYNVKLVVNHERRWDSLFSKAKEYIDSGQLGPLRIIYGNVLSRSIPRGPWQNILNEIGGGPLLHDGTHLIDLIRFFCGDITSINGRVKREDPEAATETTATAMLLSQSGIPVFIEAGGMRDYFNFEIDLHFEKGRIKVGNGIREFYTSGESQRYSGFRDLERTEFPSFKKEKDAFTGAILEVIEAIEMDREPTSSGLDGYRALEIIFGIYRSAYLEGKTVNLPLKINQHPLIKMFRKKKW